MVFPSPTLARLRRRRAFRPFPLAPSPPLSLSLPTHHPKIDMGIFLCQNISGRQDWPVLVGSPALAPLEGHRGGQRAEKTRQATLRDRRRHSCRAFLFRRVLQDFF